MFDRRLLTHIDWVLITLVTLLAADGVVNLYSATSTWGVQLTPLHLKQISWFGIGLLIALAVCIFDYRHLEYFGFIAYGVNLALLFGVLVIGKTIMGATRWIDLGFINLQPSEVLKIVIIITFARYFSRTVPALGFNLRNLGVPFLLLGLPRVNNFHQHAVHAGSQCPLRYKQSLTGSPSVLVCGLCGWLLRLDWQ